MLSGRGLCDHPILRPEESYRDRERERERERERVFNCYKMQQSTSTSTRVGRRDQTKKERKLNASEVRSNKLLVGQDDASGLY